jgi:hypothetical protein
MEIIKKENENEKLEGHKRREKIIYENKIFKKKIKKRGKKSQNGRTKEGMKIEQRTSREIKQAGKM